MATFNKPIATNQGITLLKAQVAGSDSITFTKTVFSSDDYSQSADSDIANLTAIQSMDLTVPAQTFQDVNGNTKVRAVGYNNSVNQAFYIKTYALYAKNKAGNEILFAVASSQTADFVPAFNNAQLTQISYTFTFAIDQTQNITLSDQHEITVTQADIAGINNAVNSNASSLTAQQSSYASSLSSAFSSNATNTSSAISSVSSSNNAVSSSIASTVSVNQSNIATNSNAISSLQSSVATNSSAVSNATSLASTANSNAVGAGLSVQTLESDTFRFQGKINNSYLDVSNYQNGVSNGWWSLSGVTINGLSGFSGYGIMSRASDIYNITSNSGSQSATYVQIQVMDSINETIYYNIFSYSKWVGWKQVATADGTLQFMGAVPGNTLSQVVNSGIYDLQGRSFTDYTNNIWGQLIVTVTGGVVNQTIRNNTGNMWIESVNGWGISGWKQVV